MKTREFKAIVNKEVKDIVVNSPTAKDEKEASKIYNGAFTDALKSKAVVRARLDDLLVEQGLWNDAKQVKFEILQKTILQNEQALKKGGISLLEAKELAMKMKESREELRELISVKTNLDNHTAEGQADNSRFNYLVSACTFYKENNQKVFSSYEDYLERSSEPVAILAANQLANIIYGLDSNYEMTLPENKFLRQYNFVDDQLRLIDSKGRLIDSEGRLVNEKGRLINEEGEFVDKFGNLVDEDGEYKVDFSPFLDENGKPIILEEATEATETPETPEEPAKKAKKRASTNKTNEE